MSNLSVGQITSHYPALADASISLLASGVHQHYLLSAACGKFVLRIYRTHWRTTAEIEVERARLERLQALLAG